MRSRHATNRGRFCASAPNMSGATFPPISRPAAHSGVNRKSSRHGPSACDRNNEAVELLPSSAASIGARIPITFSIAAARFS